MNGGTWTALIPSHVQRSSLLRISARDDDGDDDAADDDDYDDDDDESERDVKALFNRSTIYIAPLPEGGAWRCRLGCEHDTLRLLPL